MDIEKIISEMTLEEKAGMCSGLDFWHLKGVARLGVPSVMLTDGPHGLRKQAGEVDAMGINESIKAVCFPTASALGASFDRNLVRKIGETIGDECRAEHVAVILGPGMNGKRHPNCGRNFEYFSEDPYLTSELGTAYIQGVQSRHVGTCVKHFVCNNQEYERMNSNSVVDERTLREIYLAGFEKAVKEGRPTAVMCSYNAVNGKFLAENKKLLTEILRDEWGFRGAVITDWGAAKERVSCLNAGMDVEMPGGGPAPDEAIVSAVKKGRLDEEDLDRSVRRILKLIAFCTEADGKKYTFDYERDHAIAGKAAEECAVLLKNEKEALPLSTEDKVVFVGAFAEKPRYQGSGSSHINSWRVTSVLDAAKENGQSITYAKGFTEEPSDKDEIFLEEAVSAAKGADAVVVFAGLPGSVESEGVDRKNIRIPDNQNRLILKLTEASDRVIVVLHNGAPVEMPWIDHVQAVLEMYLGGENVGQAEYRLLYGKANPCGHLAESFPLKLEHNPAYLNYPGYNHNVEYREGIFIGYRYYDTKDMDVLFPFGHGLSYTRFEYSDLKLDKHEMSDEDELTVSLTVTNAGSRFGKETVQLYVRDIESSIARPMQELKGVEKISLQPGERKTVMFNLNKRSFAYYNTILGDWYAEPGTYEIRIGSSSRDIRLCGRVELHSDVEIPFVYSEYSSLGEVLRSRKGKSILEKSVPSMLAALGQNNAKTSDAMGEGADEMLRAMMDSMPLSTMVTFGIMTDGEMRAILKELNS
jgi:beta-glucosidase